MKYLLPILIFLIVSCKSTERLLYQDLSFLYGTDLPVIKRKVLLEKDSVSLFVSFSKTEYFNTTKELLGKYAISGRMSEHGLSSDIINLDSIPIFLVGNWEDETRIIFQFRIPNYLENLRGDFYLKLYDKKQGVIRLLDMGQIFRKSTPEKIFLLKDSLAIPITEEYFDVGEKITIETLPTLQDSINFSFYKHEFEPASPPDKILAEEIWSGEYKADSVGHITLKSPLIFSNEGLIVFSSNHEIPGCFSYRIGKTHYPYLKTASELIDPLAYITTSDEFKKLKSLPDPKIALDSFWVNIGGTKEFTRKLIKDYYSKVEFANRYFTTYKEGWKTDKGLIFIIFGPPVMVNRYENIEEWHYEDLFGKDFYTFAFIRKPVFLINDHYELIRREEHGFVWYPQIEKIRKGIIIK